MKSETFMKKAKCKSRHCSSLSNSAWCDLNIKGDIIKIQDLCNNPKFKCQKQITFFPRQFQMEGRSIKSELKSIFWPTQAARNKFLKPAFIATAPFIGMAVIEKTKNPKVGQATTSFLKTISGAKVSSLTDMHGNGLRLEIMQTISNEVC